MSEAIKIKEGGVDRSQNQISKLKTNLQGGGVCYWVPETERETDGKSITANGVYTAEQEGLYGYDEITVSVPDSGGVTGRDPITGEDVSVTVDPETGELVETVVPYAIQIENLPTKMAYYDGETIDYTGIVVGAYDAHGNRLQDVPFDELVFPINTAQRSGDSGTATYDGETVEYTKVITAKQYYRGELDKSITLAAEGDVYIVRNNGGTYYTAVSHSQGFLTYVYGEGKYIYDKSTPPGTTRRAQLTFDKINRIDGQPYYFQVVFPPNNWTDGGDWRVEKNPELERGIRYDADDIVMASATIDESQTLPVQWMRPGDYKILDDYFEIIVEPVESGTAHGNEGSGDNSGGFEGGGSEYGF